MRFGVILPNFSTLGTRDRMVEIAQEAEALGFDSLWTTDHVLMARGQEEPYGHILEAVTTLAYLASLTQQIHLGTSVLVFPQREPVLVAKQTATLDYLCGGRLILGLGAGWNEPEFGFLGATFADRGRRFDEYIQVLRTLWTVAEPCLDGVYVRFSDVLFSPRPVQPQGPPIWIGGTGPTALRRTARWGDGWHVTALTPNRIAAGLQAIHALAGDQRVEGSLRIRTAVGRTLPPQHSVVDGKPHATLSGSAENIISQLEDYQRAGVAHVICHFGDVDGAHFLDDMRRFAAEARPAFATT